MPPKKPAPATLKVNRVICGDSAKQLQKLPSECIDCVVTSPPYFQQRDYDQVAGQIGNEKKPQEYVDSLKVILDEVHRVLKPRGTMWLNLGDKFKNGTQLGMPWRVALALIDDGWILRNEVIWHKPNAMPSPARNRLTVDHETLFFFVKQVLVVPQVCVLVVC